MAAVEKLTIVYWESPVLSKVCGKVEDNEFGPELEAFGEQLIATMEGRNGLGLAAPQVGVTKRMFVMRFPEREEHESIAVVVCNPSLVLSGNSVHAQEGCLSLPNVFEQVTRAENAAMQFRVPSGKSYELGLTGFDARVAQHEFDHLNGVMFFDYKDKRPEYGARMSKQMSKNVLRNWEKEKKKRGL